MRRGRELGRNIGNSLFPCVVSITATKRRRFLWAAWWTAPPEGAPFRKPDASSGGARSREEAHAAAERAAGRRLVDIEPRWAAAWARVLRGDAPWPSSRETSEKKEPLPPPRKGGKPWAFAVLGLQKSASVLEVKRAFRAIALRTHPDRGGDPAAFIDAKRAFDVVLAAAESETAPKRARPRRKR